MSPASTRYRVHAMKTLLIAGTWSWKPDAKTKDWFESGAAFPQFLAAQGVDPLIGERPFTWSTNLGGLGPAPLREWTAAGVNLYDYVVPPRCPDRRVPGKELALVAHSHGLQVALFALAAGLKCRVLISMGSPVRRDMMDVARHARPNVGFWLHVHSDHTDRWQWLGEWGDGHFGIVREHPLADQNDFVPGVGHSELLRDPKQFHHWVSRGWLAHLKGSHVENDR